MKNAAISLFLFLLLILPNQLVFAKAIVLSENDAFIRKGFSYDWTTAPPSSPDWTDIPAIDKHRRIRYHRLDPATPVLFSFREPSSETLTCNIAFEFSGEQESAPPARALFIPDIGTNWEIYLNGKVIKSGMKKKSDGRTLSPFRRKNTIAYIPPDFLRNGTNVLSFRIAGNPSAEGTGLTINSRFVIDDMEKLYRKRLNVLPTVIIFIYLFIGIYHLFLYSRRIIDIYYLHYGLFSVFLFIYLFSKSDHMYNLITDSNIITRIEQGSLYFLIPFVAAFFDRLHRQEISRVTRVYFAFSGVIILATFIIPFHLLVFSAMIWKISALFMLSYILVCGILGHFLSELRRIRHKFLDEMVFPSALTVCSRIFPASNEGFLLAGAGITFACAVFDILDSVFFHTEIFAMNYGFLIFTAGLTFGLAKRFQGFFSKIEYLNDSLRKSISEVREANRACAVSEERYRLIIEKSKDIIFTLDREFNFISANMAIQNILDIDPESVHGRNLFDLINEHADKISTSREFIASQLEKLSSTLEPVQFKVNFNTRFASETKEMIISLEHISGAGGNEFIGKAAHVAENSLMRLAEKEVLQFRIGNYITTAEEVTHRITESLIRFMDQQKALFIRVALREILINAIEHGNLGITFEEKTAAMREGKYIDVIIDRQNDPKRRGKTIEILYSLTGDKVRYRITDEGEGFDFHSALEGNMTNEANEYSLTHGRGIIIAKNIFDNITFTRNGSRVELVKYFNKPAKDDGDHPA